MSDQPSSSQPSTSASGQEVKKSDADYEEESSEPSTGSDREVKDSDYNADTEPTSQSDQEVQDESVKEEEPATTSDQDARDKSVKKEEPATTSDQEVQDEPVKEEEPASTSDQNARDESVKKKIKPFMAPLPKVPSFRERFKKAVPKLVSDAEEKERAFRGNKYTAVEVVNEFMKLTKELQDQMLKRPYMRRMFVAAVYKNGLTNHNIAMNLIKKLFKRNNKCPVEAKEIDYCLRQFAETGTVNLDASLNVLLEQEKLKKRMQVTPEKPHFLATFTRLLKKGAEIDYIDIRVKPWNLDISFLEVKVGEFLFSTSFRNEDKKDDEEQIEKVLADVSALLEVCSEREAKITKLNVTIGGCEMSKTFLEEFIKLPRVSQYPTPKPRAKPAPSSSSSAQIPDEPPISALHFEIFQLESCKTFENPKIFEILQKSVYALSREFCNNIMCKELRFTVDRFLEIDAIMFLGVLRCSDRMLQKCAFMTPDIIPDDFLGLEHYGAPPDFEVTFENDGETGNKCLHIVRTGKEAWDSEFKPRGTRNSNEQVEPDSI